MDMFRRIQQRGVRRLVIDALDDNGNEKLTALCAGNPRMSGGVDHAAAPSRSERLAVVEAGGPSVADGCEAGIRRREKAPMRVTSEGPHAGDVGRPPYR
ncbi:MAG: hypothetical protein KFH98_15135 [Gemmatimonadetes bacterium]|nr:hypothetical protein [Gemmatimonadota bacterium]